MILATPTTAGEEHVAYLTHAARTTSPAETAPVPSQTTVVGSVATAAVLVLLITVVVSRLAPQIGPAPADGHDPCRWLAAIGIALAAAAAAVHVAVGG